MNPQQSELKSELTRILSERVSFVFSDAKTYIYARKEMLLASEDLGGGNFATAYALFALLNLLSKVHYFLHSPQKFIAQDDVEQIKRLKEELLINYTDSDRKIIKDYLQVPHDMQTNELNAFVSYGRELESKSIVLRKPHESEHKDFSTIWNGFRNMLAHLATVQSGKGIATYELKKYWPTDIDSSTSMDIVLQKIKEKSIERPPFIYKDGRSAWVMNVDALVVILNELDSMTAECIEQSDFPEDELERLMSFLTPQ